MTTTTRTLVEGSGNVTQTQEADAARADLVARLERLTQRVKKSTTTDVVALDAAYSEVVKLAHMLKAILD
jgi:hypothetical protein